MNTLEISSTQGFLLDNSNHDLSTPKCGLRKGRNIGFLSLSQGEDNYLSKSHKNPNA